MLIVRKQCAEEMQACGLQPILSPLPRCRLTNLFAAKGVRATFSTFWGQSGWLSF